MNVRKDLRRSIAKFVAPRYPKDEPGVLRLDANTNILGLNPVVTRVLRRASSYSLNQYPSAFSDDLREAIGRYHRLPAENVIVGNGSDEILDFMTKAFVNPGDRIATVSPSFVMYRFYVAVNLGRLVEVPLREDWQLDVDRLLEAKAKVTFIASPNNPTANAMREEDLLRLVKRSVGLVVVDEAYAEFCGQNWVARVLEFPNLVVTRTFSKAHGLAGLRVGYACARRELIEALHRVKPPFTVNGLSEQVAIESLRDLAFMRRSIRAVSRERGHLIRALRRLGLNPFPSDANFMLIDLGQPSRPVMKRLRKKGILTRDMKDFKGLETCLRVTIGRPEHTSAFIRALGVALRPHCGRP